jgi:hypothetical protein
MRLLLLNPFFFYLLAMNDTIIIVWTCLFFGGVVGTLLTYLFLSKRLANSRTEMQHQLQNLRHEVNLKITAVEVWASETRPGEETIRYDSDSTEIESSFTGQGSREWDYVGHHFSEVEGKGFHRIDHNTITVHRENTQGRYELYLKQYNYKNSPDKIPGDPSIKLRNLRLAFDVKKGNASHLLRFVFKGETSHNVLDEKDYVVFNPDWETVNLVFTVPTTEACFLRIDDLSVLKAPSHIQISHLVLYEKI